MYYEWGRGVFLIVKGGVAACPQIIIKYKIDMHNKTNCWHILNVTLFLEGGGQFI